MAVFLKPPYKLSMSHIFLVGYRGRKYSRGALIQEPGVSIIEVSDTAAIDQQGKSQFINDIHSQIHCTFDKIEQLIGQEGAGLKDLAAVTVFVKKPE